MSSEELIKKTDIKKIAYEGSLIYQKIKSKYEETHTGKFLAIDIESRDVYLATTSAEAVAEARKAHPNKVFYVVKIGFDVVETMVNMYLNK